MLFMKMSKKEIQNFYFFIIRANQLQFHNNSYIPQELWFLLSLLWRSSWVKHFLLLLIHFVISFSSFFTFESELFWSYSANTICWFLRQSFYESWNLLWNMYQYVWMCYDVVDTMYLCFLLHVFFRMYVWYLKKLKYATNFRDRVVCVKKKTLFVT